MTDTHKRPVTNSGRALSVRKMVLSDFITVTWRMATPVLIGAGLGLLVDSQFSTEPVFFLGLMVLGCLAGFWLAIKLVIQANNERNE